MLKACRIAVPALVLAAATWARLLTWPAVFGGDEPQLVGDSDAHYHILRTERWLAGTPGAPWRDPALNWPLGAEVPWPPMFDAILAASARTVAGPAVDRRSLVTVAAFVPLALGLLLVALVATLGRRMFGPGHGWIAAGIVALVPAGVEPSRLGRADQHVLETVLFALLLIAFVPASAARRRPLLAGSLAASAVALAFWTWMGSALHLALLAAAAAFLHLLPRDPDGAQPADFGGLVLAVGGLGGAAILATTVGAFGERGALRSFATCGVGGLQVALAALCGAFAALLHVARWRRPFATTGQRIAEVVIAAALPGAILLLVPPLRGGILGGMTALAASNPWYASISEFQPLVGKPTEPLVDELLEVLRGYGLTLVAAPLAAVAMIASWREAPARRPALVTLAITFVLLVSATLLRRRFGVYAILPIALATELAIRHWSQRMVGWAPLPTRQWLGRAAMVACSVVVVAPSLTDGYTIDIAVTREQRELLRWIGHRQPRAGGEGVLGPWDLGHVIQFYAGRPVVASPFGTEGGANAMEATAGLWFATTNARAESLLSERRCGLLLLSDVPSQTWTLHGFAPPGTPPPFEVAPYLNASADMAETMDYWRLVPVRLYHQDGLPSGDLPAIDGFRLLAETWPTSPGIPADERQWKLFEHVAGAKVVIHGHPGTQVRAAIALETNAGRRVRWVTAAEVGPDGSGTLRLPYASGANGLTRGGAWTVTARDRAVELVLDESAVLDGQIVALDATRASATVPAGESRTKAR